MQKVEYTAGDNPTVVGRQLLVVLAGGGAVEVASSISDEIEEALTIDEAVETIIRHSGDHAPDFVVAQFLGTIMQSQFRGSRLALRVARRDGTEVIFRARQASGWSTVTETDCLTAEVIDVSASTGRRKPEPVSPGSFTSSRITYRSGMPASAQPAVSAGTSVVSASVTPIVAVIEPEEPAEPKAEEVVLPEIEETEQVPVRTTLEFTTGQHVDVDRTILIGRSPRAERTTAAEIPTLLPIDSPGHAISRTHLKISIDGDRVLLEDLNSTNGTEVITADGEPAPLQPGEQALLSDGMVVSLGDHVAFRVVTLP